MLLLLYLLYLKLFPNRVGTKRTIWTTSWSVGPSAPHSLFLVELSHSLFHSFSSLASDLDGTCKRYSTLKSDFNTRHSIFKIRWLRTWSFEIHANLDNYCGPIVVNRSNKRRLTNIGSLISPVVDHVSQFKSDVE